VTRNDNGADTAFYECLREVVRANGATSLRGLEVLVKDENFHIAKKGKYGR
jgi:hypothetical protein